MTHVTDVDWFNIKAAAWIYRLPESRKGLCAGCKVIIQILWNRVNGSVESDTTHAQSPWVSVETLAEQCGAKPDTVQARLDKLTALGWIRRHKGRRLLAWGRPFPKPEASPGLADSPEAASVSETGPGFESSTSEAGRRDSSPPAPGFESSRAGIRVLPRRDSSPEDQPNNQAIEPSQDQPKVDETLAPASRPSLLTDTAPPARRRRKRVDSTQESLPIPGTEPPEQVKADQAQLVADRLWSRQAETRAALKMPVTGTKSVLDANRRGKINTRIADYGLDACYRVIEVDASDCLKQGRGGSSWGYWNLDTPFRNATNFEQRLNRWRDDGKHVPWGAPSRRDQSWSQGSGIGSREAHRAQREKLEREATERGETIPDEVGYCDNDDDCSNDERMEAVHQ